jgi:hypothetical protein
MECLVRGEWEPASEYGERLRALAEQDNDHVLWVESGYILGIAAYWAGELQRARDHFESALDRFSAARRRAHVLRYGQDPEFVVRTRLAHTLWLLGDGEGADRQRDLALTVPTAEGHAYSRTVALVFAGVLAMDRGDVVQLRRHAEALAVYAVADAPAQVRLPLEFFGGHLDVLEGRTAEGLARVRRVRELVMGPGPPTPGVPGLTTRVLLEDYAVAGEPELGLALADEALGMGRGAALWEAEIRRLRATFLAELGAGDAAVTAELQRALAVARRQRARAFEQRIRETLAERSLRHDRVV